MRFKKIGRLGIHFSLWGWICCLVGMFLFCLPVHGAVIDEVRSFLQSSYVDPVSETVLNASSIEEMLEQLGDPHTCYFTAAEYESFMNALNLEFSGIGIHIEPGDQGVWILSVIKESPGEAAGLQAGDLILEANDQLMAGLPSEKVISILRGKPGTRVKLLIQRQDTVQEVWVTRQMINLPTVSGTVLDQRIGYLDIDSFGNDTATLFSTSVHELKQQEVDCWIIDLQDNPGGYLFTAIDVASHFIGPQTVVQIQDRRGPTLFYQGSDYGSELEPPVLLLINDYSASASEILAGAVQDHARATLLGTGTYGKGTVQSLFSLSDGSFLKMTTARFYSPQGRAINQVGIQPDLRIEKNNALHAARLLLSGRVNSEKATNSEGTGSPEGSSEAGSKGGADQVQLTAGPNTFTIDLAMARTPDYWPVYDELLQNTTSMVTSKSGNDLSWHEVTAPEKEAVWPLYYPGYEEKPGLNPVPVDHRFTVRFSQAIDPATLDQAGLELMETVTGKRIPLQFEYVNACAVQILPLETLQPGATYWLTVHPTVRGFQGARLKQGVLATVIVENAEVSVDKAALPGASLLAETRAPLKPEKPEDYGSTLVTP